MGRTSALVFGFIFLASCSYFQTMNTKYPELPQDIASLELVLMAAETGALAYVSQPLCPKSRICSDINMVRKIKVAKDAAETALAAAKKSQDQNSIEAAINAIGTFKQIVTIVNP